MTAPARHNHVFHGLKKPEIADLPTACAEALPFRRQPCFRATVPIWDGNMENRGTSLRIPTHSCVWRDSKGTLGPHRVRIPGVASLARDFVEV